MKKEQKTISPHWILSALFDWSLIVLSIYLAYQYFFLIPISIFVIGNRQHALTILGHDGAHYSVAKNHTLNNFITNLFIFYPMGISMKNYRLFHFKHHRNVNNDEDPEIPLKNVGPNKINKPVSGKRIILHAIGDLFGLGIPQLIAFLIRIRPTSIWQFGATIFVILMSILLINIGLGFAVFLWFISLITTFWMCFRLRVWTEHVGLNEGETLKFDPKLWQIIMFLPHNTWLHSEHHEKPYIPFNELPIIRGNKIGQTLSEARKHQE